MSDTFQELADIPKVRLPAARMLITHLCVQSLDIR
jgi:hypothetical protein